MYNKLYMILNAYLRPVTHTVSVASNNNKTYKCTSIISTCPEIMSDIDLYTKFA